MWLHRALWGGCKDQFVMKWQLMLHQFGIQLGLLVELMVMPKWRAVDHCWHWQKGKVVMAKRWGSSWNEMALGDRSICK